MGDIWSPLPSRAQRVASSVKRGTPYDLQGRLTQAAPVPEEIIHPEPGGLTLAVQAEDPGPDFDFWFDTDEPVV